MKKFLLLLFASLLVLAVPAQKGKATAQGARKTAAAQTTKKRTGTTTKAKAQPAKGKAQQAKGNTRPAKKQQGKTGGNTISGLKARKDQLVKERNNNLQKKAQLERNVKKGIENLMVLDNEILRQRKVVDTIRFDLSNLSQHIEQLDSQLVQLESELSDRRNRFKKSMRYMHRNRSVQDQLMFVFSADNFNQMYRRARFNREYASYQKAQGEAVMSKQKQVGQKKRELSEARQAKSRLLNRGEIEQKQLESKQTEQQTQVDQLKKQQRTVQALIEQQQRQEAELNTQIDKLIAEEIQREKERREAEARKKAAAEAARKRAEELARKKAAAEAARKENERRIAEARAKEEAAKAKARAASKAEKEEAERKAREAERARKAAEAKAQADSKARHRELAQAEKDEEELQVPAADRKLSGGFEANKGRLPLPITGAYKIIRGFGTYTPEGLSQVRLRSNGWHIKGQQDAKAQCIYDGEVSGVYQQQGGGYIVTVRHGKYISAYINLSSVSVRKGQRVSTRQALGSIGRDNTMQFQLRNWSNLLNPSHWLGR